MIVKGTGYSPQIDSNETRPAILLYEFSSKRLRVLDESPPNLPFAWNPRNDVMSEDMAMLGFGIGYDLQSGIRFNTDIPLFRKEVDDGTHGIDSFVEQYVIDRSRIFVPYRRMPDSPVPFYIASVED